MTIAARLREARELAGLSTRQACRLLASTPEPTHVAARSLEAWEAGESTPTPAEVAALADLYDVRLDWLADGVDRIVDAATRVRVYMTLRPEDASKVLRLLSVVR